VLALGVDAVSAFGAPRNPQDQVPARSRVGSRRLEPGKVPQKAKVWERARDLALRIPSAVVLGAAVLVLSCGLPGQTPGKTSSLRSENFSSCSAE
jgi:hypothetical protein